jgi:hypothetical protein
MCIYNVSVLVCKNDRYAFRYVCDTYMIHLLDTVWDTVASLVLRYKYDTCLIHKVIYVDDTVEPWDVDTATIRTGYENRYYSDTNILTSVRYTIDTHYDTHDTMYRDTIQVDPRISFRIQDI